MEHIARIKSEHFCDNFSGNEPNAQDEQGLTRSRWGALSNIYENALVRIAVATRRLLEDLLLEHAG